jgi:selenocysteine lyase/cysteine desulfurase
LLRRPVSIASLELLLGWGIDNIQATLSEKTAAIADGAAEAGIGSAPASRRAGHFAGLRFPGGIPAGLAEKLAAAHVHVSFRGSTMRVTPHLYNSEEDVEKLLAVLRTTRG